MAKRDRRINHKAPNWLDALLRSRARPDEIAYNNGTSAEGGDVIEEDGTTAPRTDITLLIMLLVHVSRAIDRCPTPEDKRLSMALRAVAMRLNTHYHASGAPYGDDEAGFRAWVYERWPAPPAA